MINKRFFSIKSIIGWLVLVFIFFAIMFPSYSDYRVRAQSSEALSLTSHSKGFVMDFYKEHQRCPTTSEIPNRTDYKARYVGQLYLAQISGLDRCYIVAKFNNKSSTDKRIRNHSLVLVMEPASKWQYQVACQTNFGKPIEDCLADISGSNK